MAAVMFGETCGAAVFRRSVRSGRGCQPAGERTDEMFGHVMMVLGTHLVVRPAGDD
jgi:hypothetical protein